MGAVRRRQPLRRLPLLGRRIPSASSPTTCAATARTCGRTTTSRVVLDTFHDGRNGFLFYVTAVGGMCDGATTDERINNADWNTVWEAKVSRVRRAAGSRRSRFRSSRCATGPAASRPGAFNLRRDDPRQERVRLHHAAQARSGASARSSASSAAATLVGLEVPPAGENLEIKPYAISRLTTDLLAPPARAQRRRPRRRPRREVRRHEEPDRRLHLQHRLRAGRGRRSAGEPDALQPVVSRKARVLPRRAGHSSRSAARRRQPCRHDGGGQRRADDLLQPAHRPAGRPRGADHRRRPLVGTAGRWSIGALNIATDDDDVVARGARPTSPSLRVRRDVLRRSTIGALFTAPIGLDGGAGRQRASAGLDAQLRLLPERLPQRLRRASRGPRAATGDDLSYRAQFNYTADRYGLQLDRLVVERELQPEVGFLRARELPAQLRVGALQPAAGEQSRSIRQVRLSRAASTTPPTTTTASSRARRSAPFRIDFQNSDAFDVEYSRRLRVPAAAVRRSRDGVAHPGRRLRLRATCACRTAAGQQHRLSGTTAVDVGGFYDGDKKTASFRGRFELTPQLGVEPNISLNWIDLPARALTDTVVGARARRSR